MTTPDLTPFQDITVGSPDPTIIAAEARLRLAQLTGDVGALDRLLSEELLFTGPTGELATKEQDLASHGGGLVRFHEHVPEELRVRAVGPDVAVVALRTRLVVEVAGATHRGRFRYTRIWAREGGTEWRVVGGHVSEVVAPARPGPPQGSAS